MPLNIRHKYCLYQPKLSQIKLVKEITPVTIEHFAAFVSIVSHLISIKEF
jgi:hypothetical protein